MKRIFSKRVFVSTIIFALVFLFSFYNKNCLTSFNESSKGSTEKGISSYLLKSKKIFDINEEEFHSYLLEDEQLSEDSAIEKLENNSNFGNSLESDQIGIASWYGEEFNGYITASGEICDINQMTASHKTIPFGSLVEVTDIIKNISIVVRINDRGPFLSGRIINLSRLAAEKLNMIDDGLTELKIKIISEKN